MVGDLLKQNPYFLKLGVNPSLDGLALMKLILSNMDIEDDVSFIDNIFSVISNKFLNTRFYMSELDNTTNSSILINTINILTTEIATRVYASTYSEDDTINEIIRILRSDVGSLINNIKETLNNSNLDETDTIAINKMLDVINYVHETLCIYISQSLLNPIVDKDINTISTFGRKIRVNTDTYHALIGAIIPSIKANIDSCIKDDLDRLIPNTSNNSENIDLLSPSLYDIFIDIKTKSYIDTVGIGNIVNRRLYTVTTQSSIDENIKRSLSESITYIYLIYYTLQKLYTTNKLIGDLHNFITNNENENFSIEDNIEIIKNKVMNIYKTMCTSFAIFTEILLIVESLIKDNSLIIGERISNEYIDFVNTFISTISNVVSDTVSFIKSYEFIKTFEKVIFKQIPKPDIDVMHREKEVKLLNSYINKEWINNVLLIGDPGVGKTHIVEWLNHINNNIKIFTLESPIKVFTDLYKQDYTSTLFRFINESHEIVSRILGIDKDIYNSYDIYTKLECIFKAYEKITNKKPVLFIDEIHHMFKHNYVGDIIKSLLTKKRFRLIGATTYREYNTHIDKDTAIVRRFEKVYINPLNKEQTLHILIENIKPILENKFENKIVISDENIDKLYEIVHKYYRLSPLKDPGLSISIMDGLFSYVYNTKINANNDETYSITENDIKQYLAMITNMPIEEIVISSDRDELIKRINTIEEIIRNSVIGQDIAVDTVLKQIKKYMFGLHNGNRPIGVFLFLGPTGVGKTELAKSVAKALFGDENNMIRLDMSEFKQPHTIEKIWGSPPGYVGYNDSGILNSEIIKKPNSVILLDEIEKAHPRVLDAFLQIFDDGRMRDGRGREYDFSNTFIIMTSNMFSDKISNMTYKEAKKFIMSNITKYLKPEFVNRIDNILLFKELDKTVIEKIIDKFINNMVEMFRNKGYIINVDDNIKPYIIKNKYNKSMGARSIKRYIENTLTNAIVDYIIENNIINSTINVSVKNNKVVIQ